MEEGDGSVELSNFIGFPCQPFLEDPLTYVKKTLSSKV